jgi:hypothetical protein
VAETWERNKRMARSEISRTGSKKGYGDTEERRVFHGQILCIEIFDYKMCKMEEIMMG